uniref:C2H2-type domain-containing protein n=1 Tax=Periophthalmus magnuspinnatus TaxID=409849 RepID=A0A3B3ZK14_9GOBI
RCLLPCSTPPAPRSHTGERPFSCSICKKTFIQSGNLNAHMRIHTGERPYSCPTCQKEFKQSNELKSHMRSHTGERPYSCSMCEKTYVKKTSLKEHMKKHTGERPYSCSVCQKTFALKDYLHVHMRTHTGERPYSCSFCKKAFILSCQLTAHKRTHTGEKPFSCSICGKKFALTSGLRRHTRTHTGERPYSCSVCEKAFSSQGNLFNHKKTHTKEKPYSCTVCQKSFGQSKLVSRRQWPRCIVGITSAPRVNKEPDTFCNKGFTRKSSLTLHKSLHLTQKPFSCTVCGKGFTQKSHLKLHLDIHDKHEQKQKETVIKKREQNLGRDQSSPSPTGREKKRRKCRQASDQTRASKRLSPLSISQKGEECPVCGKVFNDLWKHMLLHTGERPFRCSVCRKGFTRVSTLTLHRRIGMDIVGPLERSSSGNKYILVLCD